MRFHNPTTSRHPLVFALLPLFAIALALAACGDDDTAGGNTDDSPTVTGSPEATPDGDGPTATPDTTGTPGAPGSPTPPPEPTPSPTSQVQVSPVDEPFEVRTTEAINVRDRPATDGNLLTTIFPGETATVIGEANGEAVEPGESTWYQVEWEGGTVPGFLYAPYVVAVP